MIDAQILNELVYTLELEAACDDKPQEPDADGGELCELCQTRKALQQNTLLVEMILLVQHLNRKTDLLSLATIAFVLGRHYERRVSEISYLEKLATE